MSYVLPRNVTSPKSSVRNVNVLLDKGEWLFSIASLEWMENGKFEPRIGIRWNGCDTPGVKGSSKGTPHSRGYPTWFILPKEIALAYAESIGNIKMKKIIELAK